METFYLIIVILLFFLAISDLVVGVSNDAVNFLNSAIGAKVAGFKVVLLVATLGILVGCTFSSGMMEVARKGIFHPEYFYFSEIILIFLAVMITDVILLDAFNTFGMPTSTTVSIVFELLGAAVGLSIIKVYTNPEHLALGEYINSGKALAIISGILLSVVVAFSAGMVIQFLTRLLFSFEYEKRMKRFGSLWGGLAIAAITYFLLVKGSKGASFMNDELKQMIQQNTWAIIGVSFLIWAVILQIVTWFTRLNIMRFIVLIGTFALAMAFAGNDLVNFIGVPLAGFNSYELWMQSGGTPAGELLMDGLAGKVPTPTLLLLMAGIIMAVTLWTSKKARSVVKTSLDLGRQHEGLERFASYGISRTLVRYSGKLANVVNHVLPHRVNRFVDRQFDERPFMAKQAHLGDEAPAFDMVRAAVTLVVASILITVGTNLKLPLSTTYVTFMVFMGTSLADGAWGRESAVYRVSGVISVVGGWFFTAFSAFTVAFIFVNIFYFLGAPAIIGVLLLAGFVIYRSHRHHGKRMEDQEAFEKSIEEDTLTKDHVVELCSHHLDGVFGTLNGVLEKSLDGLAKENLPALNRASAESKDIQRQTDALKRRTNQSLDKIIDDEIEVAHLYLLMADYLHEMAGSVGSIVESSRSHVDNNHKPLIPDQVVELKQLQERTKLRFDTAVLIFNSSDAETAATYIADLPAATKFIRSLRKIQIKRIKNHEIGTRNSILYLSHLAEYRNLMLFSDRLVRVFDEFILNE